ncbi:MAG: aminotransferase class V-fold PLP-dependent enzyme [Clostridia bacterium]|nr:aminotransferase class V-fold PLP-dependent enzyme [Clostridia bacterium]
MIYLDNAATGGFKIPSVTETATTVTKFLLANPGRSGHRLSVRGEEIVYSARKSVAKLFGVPTPNNVVFTANCTHALNLGILGTVKKGDHVVTTVFDHNSVLRPLFTLEKKGVISLTVVKKSLNGGFLPEIQRAINDKTSLVVMTGASNVTGEVSDFTAVGNYLKTLGDKKPLFMLDGAQAAGHIPIDIKSVNADLIALPAHKGIGGIQGCGALCIADGVEVEPTFAGGTGTESFSLLQPRCYPERLECGTLNLPAISAFKEAADFTRENVEKNGRLLFKRTEYLISRLGGIENVTVYSKPNPCGIVAFNVGGFDSEEIARRLNDDFDVAVRGGYHCAPLMHDYLKTKDRGAVRASASPFNTANELDGFLLAVKKISENIN